MSQSTNVKKGGLIGLAAVAAGLGTQVGSEISVKFSLCIIPNI